MEAILSSKEQVKQFLTAMYQEAMQAVADGKQRVATLKQPKRTSKQNRLMWALLTDLSEQINWYGQKLTKEEWKDVCTAAIKRQKVVPGIDGGFVVLGSSTSEMSRDEKAELIEFIQAFGAQQGVRFSAPEWMEP